MKRNYYDINKIIDSYLPIDKLIHDYRKMIKLDCPKKINSNNIIFDHYITLSLVMNPQVRDYVQKYITDLITNQEYLGYLYFLNKQKLQIPLHLNFNVDLIVDPVNASKIEEEIRIIASQFSCPVKDNLFYEITLIEILYFFTILINPRLNWITVDYILRSNKSHDYLIAHKDRIIELKSGII